MTRTTFRRVSPLPDEASCDTVASFNGRKGRISPGIPPDGDADTFAVTARIIITEELAGNIALVLVEEGETVAEYFASIHACEQIDGDTLFQVGSLSKWVSAWGVLRYDAPVEEYLSRWKLPESDCDTSGVTAGRLLSHTTDSADRWSGQFLPLYRTLSATHTVFFPDFFAR